MFERNQPERPEREIPYFNGMPPGSQPQQPPQHQQPNYYQPQPRRPRGSGFWVSTQIPWWVWLTLGIGLAVVAGSIF